MRSCRTGGCYCPRGRQGHPGRGRCAVLRVCRDCDRDRVDKQSEKDLDEAQRRECYNVRRPKRSVGEGRMKRKWPIAAGAAVLAAAGLVKLGIKVSGAEAAVSN